MNRTVGLWRDRAAIILAAMAIWQVGSLLIGDFGLPGPWSTLVHIAELASDDWFWRNAAETGRALLLAALIAILGGVSLGAWLGVNRYAGAVAEPVLSSLYSLPKITFYPVMLLIFGLGFAAKVAFGAIHGIIPCTLFTVSAVRNIPPIFHRTGLAMGLRQGEIVRRILLPAALPETLTGVRIGLALSLLGTLIGEMFASQAGLGYMLRESMERAESLSITALAVILMLFALALNGLIVLLSNRFGPGTPA